MECRQGGYRISEKPHRSRVADQFISGFSTFSCSTALLGVTSCFWSSVPDYLGGDKIILEDLTIFCGSLL